MIFNCKWYGKYKNKLDYVTMTYSKEEKLLGIIFNDRLKFQYHIKNLCKKVRLKLSALSLVAPLNDHLQKKILFKPFFQSPFSHCPLVWMCHSRILNTKIDVKDV